MKKTPWVKNIIWDWNGTLLNDRELCIESMNKILERRALPLLSTHRYLNIFTFPVQNYYQQLGFDFTQEPFEVPAMEFIQYYKNGLHALGAFRDAHSTLTYFKNTGTRQFILSAMEQQALKSSVDALGLMDYFQSIRGINNHLAKGKSDIAKMLLRVEGINPMESIMVGDTCHDAEVGRNMGVKTILIAQGHQSKERLKQTGNLVLDSLNELVDFMEKQNKGLPFA